jgi:hypothetical protein
MTRIDSCRITMTAYVAFEGYRSIDFTLPLPIDLDDPLIVMLLERHRQIIEAQVRAADPCNPFA